jgi:hypothetical protein
MIKVDNIYPTYMYSAYRSPIVDQNMHTITFHFRSICGRYTDMTPEDIRYRYFNDNARYKSFKNYFAECSQGRKLFLPQNNMIISNLDFPCYGTSKSGYRYNMNQCNMEEMYSLAEYVEEYAHSQNIDMSKYKSRIILLPKDTPCWWAGLASIGCDRACYVWTIMSKSMPFTVLMHELGHNNGLMHSNIPSKEYGDSSCTMGMSPQVCFNAPQSWRLGWHRPLSTIYISSSSSFKTKAYQLPCQQNTTHPSFVLLIKDQTAYTVSYRCNYGKYENALGDFDKSISIHSTSVDLSQPSPSVLLSVLQLGQRAHIPNTNTMIEFSSKLKDKNYAVIKVCNGIC